MAKKQGKKSDKKSDKKKDETKKWADKKKRNQTSKDLPPGQSRRAAEKIEERRKKLKGI